MTALPMNYPVQPPMYKPPQLGRIGGAMVRPPTKQPPDTRPVPPGTGGIKPGPGAPPGGGVALPPVTWPQPGAGNTKPGQGAPPKLPPYSPPNMDQTKPWAGGGGAGGGPQLGGGLLPKLPPGWDGITLGGPGGIKQPDTIYGELTPQQRADIEAERNRPPMGPIRMDGITNTKPMPAPWTPPPLWGELPPGMSDPQPTRLPPQMYPQDPAWPPQRGPGGVSYGGPSPISQYAPPQFDQQVDVQGQKYGDKPRYGSKGGMPTGGYRPPTIPTGIQMSVDPSGNPISLAPPQNYR